MVKTHRLRFLKRLQRRALVVTYRDTVATRDLSAALATPVQNTQLGSGSIFQTVPGAAAQTLAPAFGLDLHAQLSLDARSRSAGRYFVAATYESANNELNRPPYTVLSAGASLAFHNTEVALLGRNLSNVADGLFTLRAAGTPYPTPAGPAPTDAFALQGRSLTLTVTQRY